MQMTTLCYLERDGKYLMLHRVKKKNDMNVDKWIGIGGKMEEGESPEDCILREVKEETGLTMTDFSFRGLLTFVSKEYGTEYMCLFTSSRFEGELLECNEGNLEWVEKEKVLSLNLWEGDKLMFQLLDKRKDFFTLKLCYRSDQLVEASVDYQPCEFFDIVDNEGQPTGLVKERTLAHREGTFHRTAHIWIVRPNENGSFDVLLQKRSKCKDSHPGCYDISSAGHVTAGCEVLPSALRELKEELGITATPDQLNFGFCLEILWRGEFYGAPFIDHEYSTIYLYYEDVDTNHLSLQQEEVESVRWMDYEECLQHVKRGDMANCINPEEFSRLKDSVMMLFEKDKK